MDDAPFPVTGADLPSPPFVPLHGIANFRDLGGAVLPPSASGTGPGPGPGPARRVRRVRRGLVFRSADPTRAPAATIDTVVRTLGVTHVFDLRSRPEIARSAGAAAWPDVSGAASAAAAAAAAVTVVAVPVFADEAYDPASLAARFADYMDADAAGLVRAYRAILVSGAGAYAAIARHLVQTDAATLFHCTAGKDRTGVLGALLLSLCGVPDAAIADEYHLTEAGLGAEWTDALVRAVLAAMGPRASEAGARRMGAAPRAGMLATLQMLRADFGGAAGYFETTCGLSAAEVAALKERLIEEVEAEADNAE